MKIEEKKKKILKLVEEKESQLKELREKYDGPGILKKIKRLFRFRGKYLKYAISKLTSISLFAKVKTPLGECWLLPAGVPSLYFYGLLDETEVKLTKFFIKNLKENSIFYDIGAFCGYYSLLAKEFVTMGEIHAFEPIPKNLSNVNYVFLNKLALFNKEGKIDFYEDPGGSGSTSNLSYTISSLHRFKKIEVEAITLDKYCLDHSSPDFLKIDVEFSEDKVIEGGINTLTDKSPIIAMEVCRKLHDNRPHLRAMEILYKLGYKSYRIKENGELQFIKRIIPEKEILVGSDNFVFLK